MRRHSLPMFGWRKKSDGFDWHAYVRTTIKVRREARRERVDAARLAALEKAHAAGHAVVDGGKAAGRAAVQGARDGAVQGAKGLSWVWHSVARGLRAAFGPFGEWLMTMSRRAGGKLQVWDIAAPVALVGGIAIASAMLKWRTAGFNAETAVPLGIGAVLLLLAAPALLGRLGVKLPPTAVRYGLAGLAAFAIGGGAYYAQKSASLPSFGSLSKISLMPQSAPPIEGRAAVVAADTLRVNGTLMRLTGIDAPEKSQSCLKDGKRRWRCGEAAVTALEKLARGKTVRCAPAGAADTAGRVPAACAVDSTDIAGELVRGGHVFSSSSMFGGYASQESEAKKAAAGLWSGESERPAAFRAKVWDEAKKSAPDGCPIKAVSMNGSKVYLLPWSDGYKKAQVKTSKGERWFCSEGDAAAAGFRPERT